MQHANQRGIPLNNSSTFQNDNLSVVVTKEPGCLVKFEVALSPKASQEAYNQSIKAVNKEISIPGFRKGRAPDAMITQHYSKYVNQEWDETLLRNSFEETIKLTNLSPFAKETVRKPQIISRSKEEGCKITFEFEVHPDVPTINLNDITIEPVTPEPVTDQMIEDEINQIREHHATWTEITEKREIKEGDHVVVDIADAKQSEEAFIKDRRLKATEKEMSPWLFKLLIGKSVGDTVEGSDKAEGEAACHDESCTDEHHSHNHVYRVTIKRLEEPVLPPADDALAQLVKADNLQDLKDKIRKRMENSSQHVANEQQKQMLTKILLDKYSFEIPLFLLKDAKRQSSERQKEIKEWYQTLFLLNHFASENQIRVADEDVKEQYMKQMFSKQFATKNQEEIDHQAEYQSAYTTVLLNTVMNYIISKTKITAE